MNIVKAETRKQKRQLKRQIRKGIIKEFDMNVKLYSDGPKIVECIEANKDRYKEMLKNVLLQAIELDLQAIELDLSSDQETALTQDNSMYT